MQSFIACLTTLLLTSAVAFAGVLDPLARIESSSRPVGKSRSADSGIFRSMIIECSSPEGFEQLRDSGIVIYNTRGNMALACVPEHMISGLDSWPSLMRATMSRRLNINLDKARGATMVDRAHTAAGLPSAFTGKGVVVGLSDVGFDPGHINFSGRIKGMSHYVDTLALSQHFDSVYNDISDNPHRTHATHVAGIMAGGDRSTPYYGVAPEADIYASTSILHDVGILAGVEDIIAYSRQRGCPAVINLSLGSKIGPHDGTDAFCRYLDLCAAEDAAILLAAGNDGDMHVSVSKSFSDADSVLSMRLRSTFWDDVTVYNAFTDVWSSDSRPLRMRLRAWDKINEETAFATTWIDFTDNEIWQISSESNPEFSRFYDGEIKAAAEVNPANSRYNISISFGIHCREMLPDHPWSRYSMIIDIAGADGARADAFIEGECEFTFGPPNEVSAPDARCSVSSIACGHNPICVGAATTRAETPVIDGNIMAWNNLTPGTVSYFSSWGTLPDGRTLPHFCAPGAMIVSSLSRHYHALHPEIESRVAAASNAAAEHLYYAEAGTSMATPHAAGIFALWLQADPTLTGPELRKIAIASASPLHDPEQLRTGAGLIDAEAGLRLILGSQSIADRELIDGLTVVRRLDNRLEVAGAEDARIEVYDLTGRRCPADALPKSPVIVRIIGKNGIIVRKI